MLFAHILVANRKNSPHTDLRGTLNQYSKKNKPNAGANEVVTMDEVFYPTKGHINHIKANKNEFKDVELKGHFAVNGKVA